ncbi:hypothetical protein AAFF_G00031420 [Aldrovandia affinis]|uniref:Uncharacterized protein n=1 Tax=Aldrovandia affinis TaxID=143900 RepID=A0AAD7R2F4_9TELE|nr:hypothetical protein AAFF_G00031420 [Aldrovandia affinis]
MVAQRPIKTFYVSVSFIVAVTCILNVLHGNAVRTGGFIIVLSFLLCYMRRVKLPGVPCVYLFCSNQVPCLHLDCNTPLERMSLNWLLIMELYWHLLQKS